MGYAARWKDQQNRMKRVLDLDATNATDRNDYRMLCDALTTRGSQARDPRTGELPRLSKEDMRSDARIKIALKKIGEPDNDQNIPEPKGDELDRRPLKLKGGTLELDQSDFKRLQGYVEQAQWTIPIVDLAMELVDRLDAAKEVKDGATDTEPARPRRVARA